MRLIDADALIKEANADGAYGYVDAKQIADAPTIDAVKLYGARIASIIIGNKNPVMERSSITVSCLI